MPGTERRNGEISRRLRRERMALRMVAVTMRAALREHDRHAPTPERSAWATDLVTWIEGVLDYHRGRIEHLRRELLEGDPPGDETPDRLQGMLGDLQDALADAEAAAAEARARVAEG